MREAPYDEEQVCDGCGRVGAYDFMGDYLCDACAEKEIKPLYTNPQQNPYKAT